MASEPYDPYVPSARNSPYVTDDQGSPYPSSSQNTPHVPGSSSQTPYVGSSQGTPYVGSSQGTPYVGDGDGTPGGQNKTAQIQKDLDRATDAMRENIRIASQRGDRLDSLQDKSDQLAESAQGFRRGANQVRKQMWWKDMKMKIWIGIGITVLLAIIIIPAVVTTTGN